MAPGTEFRFAPLDWTQDKARATGTQEGLTPGDDHWEVVRALQEFYARHHHVAINLRELQDALQEKFHHKGGMKYLYTLFPGGPVAQGCRLAGLQPPSGSTDRGFGSVT
ncbi:MAG: sulfite reductase [Betaproteobacteria bacterium RIFCSPLOWO2_02_FULL_67_19]|nr:MAG: sulfite reductase [Betaproteobacteria bacterium RIFCSPLOWO2_02_FULL_67_19]